MTRTSQSGPFLRRHLAAIRALVVLTALTGVVYPLAVTAVAQTVFHNKANGSVINVDGKAVGSSLIGQAFQDDKGNAIGKYFQSRPSSAGTGNGYDPTSSSASNLGPESVVDTLATAGNPSSAKQSLLTGVCSRSAAVGQLEGVDGGRPYCTADGVGAVLAVFPAVGTPDHAVSVNQACPAKPFLTTYQGVPVTCANPGDDYSAGRVVPVDVGPAHPQVPADAVTASASGLDPDISVAYAELQIARVAKARNLDPHTVAGLVAKYTTGRALGFMGDPVVNVLELNLALDQRNS
ncbi:MAG TPA: potassium-transporting ATPase subunit C [Sporichthyaceae bacterium]|jgi:K+-transporting ATPase ATPase C chain|nr:potassium-transporting ATPase subunit C [Sporichthyaceae bacterium]